MDTKYWGPSGWRLLHLIAEKEASMKPVAAEYWAGLHMRFWSLLPYVLPCKFCRASLTTYYEKYPIPTDNRAMGRWLYKIHNCVSDKLRSQGQHIPTPPSYSEVKKYYRELLNMGCTELSFPGWEFLFCIADNYPGSAPSTPMPDAPEGILAKSPLERNKYNLLTTKERIEYLAQFWYSLGAVMPFQQWRAVFDDYCGSRVQCVRDFRGSAAAKSRLWALKCRLEEGSAEEKDKHSYSDLCRVVASKRSGCSASPRAKTCRAPVQALTSSRRAKTQKKKHDNK